jgi:hypothetical protein
MSETSERERHRAVACELFLFVICIDNDSKVVRFGSVFGRLCRAGAHDKWRSSSARLMDLLMSVLATSPARDRVDGFQDFW